MTTGEMIAIVKKLKNFTKFSEVSHKTTFDCIHRNDEGLTVGVTLDIIDTGPNELPQNRYYCVAKTEYGQEAMGNLDATIEGALLNVHWDKLDVSQGE
ncbi:MAG: hypothetical protein ISS70_17740 [Phycisphaerae bacterium]|nr:hypothetical protein [Phycisphaerae bacterium]